MNAMMYDAKAIISHWFLGEYLRHPLRLDVRGLNPSEHSGGVFPIFPYQVKQIYQCLEPIFQFAQAFNPLFF
jgi:hypothetical protein